MSKKKRYWTLYLIRNHLPTLKKELELILQEIGNTPKL